ncbi:MAG: 1-acyl-sn-glycerol-3-phosphate acyltransferase [Elusimicrobium sp.]|jgi:1-acyl-sn-glycerol-3-phosphate acyltransferase|nr:1-acyl-sn-glycerol-3-phosphate acyltransferase [Elusimicrobium sp.]
MTTFLLNLIKWIFRTYLGLFYNAKAVGLENIPKTGRLIIVSNHVSNVDPPLLGGYAGLVRDSRYIIKKSLMKVPVLGFLFNLFGFIPVERAAGKDLGAFKAVLAALNKEESVMLFPEGTRSRDGQPQQAKAGVSFLAHKSGAPVLISRVFNTYGFPWRRKLRVVFSHTIKFEEVSGVDLKEQYRQFADRIMKEISEVN